MASSRSTGSRGAAGQGASSVVASGSESFLQAGSAEGHGQATTSTAYNQRQPAPFQALRYGDDRRPAPLADVGTILPWSGIPSVFNAQSIFAVLASSPVTAVNAGTYTNSTAAAATATTPTSTATTISTATSTPWAKRPAFPLLTFTDVAGNECQLTDGSVNSDDISQCSTRAQSSLRLDVLLAAGQDIPTQVFKCTVLPQGFSVVLKLLTDQADKMPCDLRIAREIYEQVDFGKDSLGHNAQMTLSREADNFLSIAPLQGTVCPYSYGFYPFALPDGSGVVGHVQEWIPSEDFQVAFADHVKLGADGIDRFLTSMFKSYLLLHLHEIAHMDIAVPNILVYREQEILRFAIIDLTMAVSITYCEATHQWWAFAEECFMDQCLTEQLDSTVSSTWLRTANGRQYMKLFSKGPKELAECDLSEILPPLVDGKDQSLLKPKPEKNKASRTSTQAELRRSPRLKAKAAAATAAAKPSVRANKKLTPKARSTGRQRNVKTSGTTHTARPAHKKTLKDAQSSAEPRRSARFTAEQPTSASERREVSSKKPD